MQDKDSATEGGPCVPCQLPPKTKTKTKQPMNMQTKNRRKGKKKDGNRY